MAGNVKRCQAAKSVKYLNDYTFEFTRIADRDPCTAENGPGTTVKRYTANALQIEVLQSGRSQTLGRKIGNRRLNLMQTSSRSRAIKTCLTDLLRSLLGFFSVQIPSNSNFC